jgi:hypothetical protein
MMKVFKIFYGVFHVRPITWLIVNFYGCLYIMFMYRRTEVFFLKDHKMMCVGHILLLLYSRKRCMVIV